MRKTVYQVWFVNRRGNWVPVIKMGQSTAQVFRTKRTAESVAADYAKYKAENGCVEVRSFTEEGN